MQKTKSNPNKKLIDLPKNNSSKDRIEDQEEKEINKEIEILEDKIVQGTMIKDKIKTLEEENIEKITTTIKERIMRIDIDKMTPKEHSKDDRIGDRTKDKIREITEQIKEEIIAEKIEKELAMSKKTIAIDKKENTIQRRTRIIPTITKEENNAAEEQDAVLLNIIMTKAILKVLRMMVK